MLRYGLRRRDVAELLGKPLNSSGGYSNSTVDRWLAGNHRVPEPFLELLTLKLAGRKERPDAWQRLLRQPVAYASQRELERDLAEVLKDIDRGILPRTPRTARPESLRRAGYLLELIAHFGGDRFAPVREKLLAEAAGLRKRIRGASASEPFRRGDSRPVRRCMDDLARKWRLSRGVDIRRFRQLARTGVV